MKNQFLFILGAFILFVISCDNEETPRPNDGVSNEEIAAVVEKSGIYEEKIDQSLDLYIWETLSAGRGVSSGTRNLEDCTDYTVTETEAGYNVVLTFPAEGCDDQWGNLHYGTVTADITMGSNQINVIKTFENYHFNQIGVVGNINSEITTNSEQQRVIEREAVLALTDSTGVSNNRTSDYTIVRISGNGDNDYTNDVYSVTGGSTNNLSTGTTWNVTNLSAVIRPGSCQFYAVSGQKNIVNFENNSSYFIDYGDGSCDGVFDLTLPDGSIITVSQN